MMYLEFRIRHIIKRRIICNSRFVVFGFVTLMLIAGACSNPYKNLSSTELSKSDIKEIPYTLPYSNKALIYKADINFYKNNISGLLIIKRTSENNYRIALTTQFGLKIFDFRLDNGVLGVEYCIEYLNKKMILKTFENDFNLLLIQNRFESIEKISDTEKNRLIWQLNQGKSNYNYIQDIDQNKISSIVSRKRNSDKISVGLHAYKGEIPGEIKLEHHNIKLYMNLKLLQ